ncbi:MAG: hypothetical protein R3325_03710 [Thermoanaerobaculia bacterium]|nr:hypothetical protein [Thermoanaerobaculia bacterium]
MDWTRARDRNLVRWRRILAGIGVDDPPELLRRLNEVGEVCELAREDAGGAQGRCDHCLVFGSAGECLDLRWKITRALLEAELDEARSLVRGVVARTLAARPAGDDR